MCWTSPGCALASWRQMTSACTFSMKSSNPFLYAARTPLTFHETNFIRAMNEEPSRGANGISAFYWGVATSASEWTNLHSLALVATASLPPAVNRALHGVMHDVVPTVELL